MGIIKETDSIQPQLSTLEEIAELVRTSNPAVHKQVIAEIKKRKAGHSAEVNAAFMLGKIYRDSARGFLLNDLRLDIEGDVAQIDHVVLNDFGMVNLFETKSFSSGLQVDKDGTCWTWLGRLRKEIPSPLRQSQRHEGTLRKALAACGYDAIEFRHFVLVDYKARLTKPKKGFENFCRPDRFDEANDQVALGTGSAFRALGRWAVGKRLDKSELCKVGEELAALHQPLQPDFWGQFGLSQPEVSSPAEVPMLTSSRLANKLGLRTQDFLLKAAKSGLAYEMDGCFFASLDGEQLGAKNCKGRYGPYILWPQNLSL
ncbi:nuclease-related domain-containing protein [Marinospirillum sp.]|uniref:nuclease-related domain-containing protein n=1 Tax=Marinospirillum sp. TaxID=2183934 RepID=UPI00384AFB5B